MIFAARGLLVSLAFFAMLYCPLSALVVLAWKGTNNLWRNSRLISPNLLFALRILPFFLSAAIAVFFTFPSFWLMERASLDEDAGTFILSACSLVILSAGLFRMLQARARTRSAVSHWSFEGPSDRSNETLGASATMSASNGAPGLILVGLYKPKVLISDLAAAALNDQELQVAVRHELAHKRSGDNLKKILISATPFPGMTSLETAWRDAAELAADDAAVVDRQDALDLAAALIKLSRSSSKRWSEAVLASALVSGSSSIGLRVKRLLEWNKPPRCFRFNWTIILLLVFTAVRCIVSNYGATLALTHRLTEILVP